MKQMVLGRARKAKDIRENIWIISHGNSLPMRLGLRVDERNVGNQGGIWKQWKQLYMLLCVSLAVLVYMEYCLQLKCQYFVKCAKCAQKWIQSKKIITEDIRYVRKVSSWRSNVQVSVRDKLISGKMQKKQV